MSNDGIHQPLLHTLISPQNKMVWVPNLEVQLCPMKLQLDVDYILRVLSLIFDSVSKYRKEDIKSNQAIIHVNEDLKYITRGSMNFCLTYIENFNIHPVEVQLEINIKSDEEDGFNDEVGTGGTSSSSLTLHAISQSTNSGMYQALSLNACLHNSLILIFLCHDYLTQKLLRGFLVG
jgi:hypothetical protein